MVRLRVPPLYSALAFTTAALAVSGELLPRQDVPFQTTPFSDFAEPWALAFLPDDRILVTEREGTLQLFDPATNSKGEITGVPPVRYFVQGGLGDVVLHPDFAQNSLVYISYAGPSGRNESAATVSRARLELDANGGGTLEDLEVIWRQTHPIEGGGHYGHRILFGADSTLWIPSSDRQLFYPSQDMTSNLGKIIHLNDDGTIPEGNPFSDPDNGEVAAQVWAMGVRNVLGLDWDSEGRLWIIDMGPRGGDEVNLIERGGNYGWPVVSWGIHYNGTSIPDHDTRPEFILPRTYWDPVISPAGMIIYKGDLFPGWKGNMLISALTAEALVRVEIDGGTGVQEVERVLMGRRMRAIRESADGAVWMLEDGPGGRLLKLTPS